MTYTILANNCTYYCQTITHYNKITTEKAKLNQYIIMCKNYIVILCYKVSIKIKTDKYYIYTSRDEGHLA